LEDFPDVRELFNGELIRDARHRREHVLHVSTGSLDLFLIA
jgi:hypothetical protein